MDGEHIFSASIVLVMTCAAFPTNVASTMAMNAGLSLLRGMGERGNSHMGARYELLAKLQTGMTPGSAPPAGATQSSPGTNLPEFISSSVMAGSQLPGQVPIPPVPNLDAAVSSPGSFPANGLTFPAINNSSLDEPFFDESITSGMDFGLWEEGFAYPTMDLDFNLAHEPSQQQPTMMGMGQETAAHNTGSTPTTEYIYNQSSNL